MTTTATIKEEFVLDCAPDVAFKAWLDSKSHGEMLASPGEASIDGKVGGTFSIWDGAITGKTLEIDDENLRIVQDWRYDYDDWSKDAPSKLSITFAPHENEKTLVQVLHTDLPENHVKELTEGWNQYYWAPMKEYFSKNES